MGFLKIQVVMSYGTTVYAREKDRGGLWHVVVDRDSGSEKKNHE
jgi:hypothetical protein